MVSKKRCASNYVFQPTVRASRGPRLNTALDAAKKMSQPLRNKFVLACIGASLVVPLLVAFVPALAVLGPTMIVAGMLLVIYIGHSRGFKVHKLGLFGQWSEPTKVLGAPLSEADISRVYVAVALVVGGLLTVILLTTKA